LLKLVGHGAQKESQNSPLAGDQSIAHLCSCFVALYTYYSTTVLFGQIIKKPAEAGCVVAGYEFQRHSISVVGFI
jgi:hypothetical protein